MPATSTRHVSLTSFNERCHQTFVRSSVRPPGRKEAGRSLNEARARLPGFLARTDREIAIARGELLLTPEEQIDRFPRTAALDDPEVQELLLEGARVDPDLSQAQRERMVAVVTGELIPEPVYTAEDLIAVATKLKHAIATQLLKASR